MSESFNERNFVRSLLIALGGLGIGLLVGFITILAIEPSTIFDLIEFLFFTPDITNYVNPVIVFITAICLNILPGPGIIIWVLNIDPITYSDLLSGILIASFLTWTIVGFIIGFIVRKPQKALYQGLLTIIFSLIFTIVMELILVGSAGLLLTGPFGVAAIGIGILLTVFFSLIMVVYCPVVSIIAAEIANRVLPPKV
ncbi:MAG: hypothetical protein ACTSPY_07380 [Candidatus Helarchaeota archaeon]